KAISTLPAPIRSPWEGATVANPERIRMEAPGGAWAALVAGALFLSDRAQPRGCLRSRWRRQRSLLVGVGGAEEIPNDRSNHGTRSVAGAVLLTRISETPRGAGAGQPELVG